MGVQHFWAAREDRCPRQMDSLAIRKNRFLAQCACHEKSLADTSASESLMMFAQTKTMTFLGRQAMSRQPDY